jgi:rod shape-determining protein MreB
MLSLFQNKNFAIDLGNNNTLLTDENQILYSQPSYIVFDEEKNSVKAIGDEAYEIFEKNHHQLKPVKPLHWGVIADYESASQMINKMVRQVYKKNVFTGFNQIISGVPFATTEVERRALRDTLDQFNSRRTHLLFEPFAAALGMGLNIREPEGKMIIDIGGGITEIVVISLSGVAVFKSIKTAGDSFTDEIQDYFRRTHNLAIGWKTAEQVKIKIGAATTSLKNAPSSMLVKGKDIREGLPVTKNTSYEEIALVLNKSIESIELAIQQTLEICPPELAADIYQNGIYLTGGGSLLHGLQERINKTTSIPVHLDKEPLLSVGKGISQALRDPKKFQSVLFE